VASVGLDVQALSGLVAKHEAPHRAHLPLDVLHPVPFGAEGASVQPAAAIRHQFTLVDDLLPDAVLIFGRQWSESIELHAFSLRDLSSAATSIASVARARSASRCGCSDSHFIRASNARSSSACSISSVIVLPLPLGCVLGQPLYQRFPFKFVEHFLNLPVSIGRCSLCHVLLTAFTLASHRCTF